MPKEQEEMITITKAEYDELVETSWFMTALESAGVDNWDGYDIAKDILEEMSET